MEPRHYFEALYPLQDRVLRLLQDVETGFYLTGGTAASRGYLNHRFSDDLDFFANDSPEFQLWSQRIIQALQGQSDSTTEVAMRDQRFARVLCSAAQRDWELVRWIDPPDPRLFVSELHSLGEQLLLV